MSRTHLGWTIILTGSVTTPRSFPSLSSFKLHCDLGESDLSQNTENTAPFPVSWQESKKKHQDSEEYRTVWKDKEYK